MIEGKFAYVGDYEGKFFSIDLEAGKIAWTYHEKDKNLPFIASPALNGNFIVIGNQDKFIYCFEKKYGQSRLESQNQ